MTPLSISIVIAFARVHYKIKLDPLLLYSYGMICILYGNTRGDVDHADLGSIITYLHDNKFLTIAFAPQNPISYLLTRILLCSIASKAALQDKFLIRGPSQVTVRPVVPTNQTVSVWAPGFSRIETQSL